MPKFLAFSSSVRNGSYNRRLIELAARHARELGAEVDLADFREFDMPLFNGDLNEESGLPAGARALIRRLERADGLMIAAPEYNYSIPGNLKNAIDWASRSRPQPFKAKSGLIMAASPSVMGGIRGLWQLRIPLEGLGVFLHPEMFALAQAHVAFDDRGQILDATVAERLRQTVADFVQMATALARRISEPGLPNTDA